MNLNRLARFYSIALIAILSFIYGKEANAKYYLPYSHLSEEQKSLSEEQLLELAVKELQKRVDPNIKKTLIGRIQKSAEANAQIASLSGKDAESLKAKEIVWQTGIARHDIDTILKFHVDTSSDFASQVQWFWANHFSIFGMKRNVKIFLADYDINALSVNAVGSFKDLLTETVLHPAMIIYLDNHANREKSGNENLAREILELHTLGVNAGYSQADVQSLAKALTGFTVAGIRSKYTIENCRLPQCRVINSSGTILELDNHDKKPKKLLGKIYNNTDGLEVFEMLSDLSSNPKSYERLSFKLSQYFLKDEPDSLVVNELVASLQASKGDLKVLYRTLLKQIGRYDKNYERFSDPFFYLMRVARVAKSVNLDIDYVFANKMLRDWGQGLYLRVTPDGYPLDSMYWSGAASLSERLNSIERFINIGSEKNRRTNFDGKSRHITANLIPKVTKTTRELLKPYENSPQDWLIYMLVSPEIVFH